MPWKLKNEVNFNSKFFAFVFFTNSKITLKKFQLIILIVAGGFLTCLILFIFGKRQIMRYAIRNKYSPHYPLGQDAKKNIKKELERRLDSIQRINSKYEPQLIENSKYILKPGQKFPPYYYRQKAVDDIKLLVDEIPVARGQTESLRSFLLTSLSSTLNGSGQRMIHQFCDMYDGARHDPNEFGDEEYQNFHRLLMKLIDAAKVTKNTNSCKSSPSRTPVKKQSKMQSLLDPSRLRPPPPGKDSSEKNEKGERKVFESSTSNAQLNLSLGVQLQQDEILSVEML